MYNLESDSLNILNKKIEESKAEYIRFAIQHTDKDLYIYGAGRMAKPLLKVFSDNDIDVKGFCVSEIKENKRWESGKPIVGIEELIGKQVAFAFGVNPRLNDQIENTLQKFRFTEYLRAPEYLRYFGKYQYDFYCNPMVEITTRIGCAVNCKFCPQGVLLKAYYITGNEPTEMSLELYKTCIDKLPQNTLIEFAGFTEPFFNNACLDMIKYAFQRGYKVNLFTTLCGVTPVILDAISDIQFEEFVLHVPDIEGYANIPINDVYYDMLEKLVDMKKPNGDDFIDYACSQGEIPSTIRERLGNKVRLFISLLDRAGNLDDDSLFGARDVRGKLRCEVSNTINHNVLLPDGRLVLCAQDYGLKHVLGNLYEKDYEEIMNGEIAQGVIRNMMSDDNYVLCRDCSLARVI